MLARRRLSHGSFLSRIAIGYGMARKISGGIEPRRDPRCDRLGELEKLADAVSLDELDLMTREQRRQRFLRRLLSVEARRPVRR